MKMAKITIKATLQLSNREILIMRKALNQYKLTTSHFDHPAINNLIELMDNLNERIKWKQEKERRYGKSE